MDSKKNSNKPMLPFRASRRSTKSLRGDMRRTRKAMSKVPGNPKFEGAEENLKGQVYSLGYQQADMYVKTTKAIALYVGKTY